MDLQASDDGSPSQAALEDPLTLNRRQSWFGSFRSVVHRSAVSAKAAVESLRGSRGDVTPTTEPEESCVCADIASPKHATPDKPRRSGTLTSKSAVASLRRNLSHHSRSSTRGSISKVFHRSGSNASSLRDAQGPEAIVRNSQDLSKATSPLSRDGNTCKDPATLVPLPSSPIQIPPPVPTLQLDFGPPAMLSPFKLTSSDIAEIKALQDPTNITAGLPPSPAMEWLRQGSPLAARNVENEQASDQDHPKPSQISPPKEDDVFGHDIVDLPPKVPPHFSLPTHSAYQRSRCLPDLPAREMKFNGPSKTSREPPTIPNMFNVTAAGFDEHLVYIQHQGNERNLPTGATTSRVPSAVNVDGSKGIDKPVTECRSQFNDSVSPLQSSSAPVARGGSSAKDTGNIVTAAVCTKSMTSPAGSEKPPAYADIIRAQEKYRDSLAGVDESQPIEALEPEITRFVEQNPFVGAPGAPGYALRRSASVRPTAGFEPLNDASEMRQISEEVSATPKTDESGRVPKPCDRKDSIMPDALDELSPPGPSQKSNADQEDLPSAAIEPVVAYGHGTPSPGRSIRLPLRLKSTPTKSTSPESMMFQPMLDRIATNSLGVFGGSEQSLRQKYFPHSLMGANVPVEHSHQPSVDSSDAGSSDTVGIFERTVEQPSPLQIRKQSSAKSADLPQTPVKSAEEVSTPQPPGSSPNRTPSMGDRHQFDLQRAERNARYNAIQSEQHDIVLDDDSDLQLAEFGNAGPGSQGSTPKRQSGGLDSGIGGPTSTLERPSPRSMGAIGKSLFLALSRD